ALEANGENLRLVATEHEPLLEGQLAVLDGDPRTEPVVCRREEAGRDPQRASEALRDRREQLAALERLPTGEVKAEIPVAELKPGVGAEVGGGLQGVPGLVRASPSPSFVPDASKRVEESVDVGRDVQAVQLDIVADVADHGHLGRIGHVEQPLYEPGAADSAAQDGDLQSASCS